AWQISGDSLFREVCERTLAFIARELLHPQGGFFSSLDADSEGQEGKYYVWTEAELAKILGEEFPLFKQAYGIREYGNWEGKTILQRALDDQTLAAYFRVPIQEVRERLLRGHRLLFEHRRNRIPPATDRKVLASWNGLALAVFAEAGRVFGVFDDVYGGGQVDCVLLAIRNANFLFQHLKRDYLSHSWYEGQATPQTFLEDYASLILALLELYQTDFNPEWYAQAKALTQEMLNLFSDGSRFFDTPSSKELPLRPRQIEDNAIPSGSALATTALLLMSAFEGKQDWHDYAIKSLEQQASLIGLYPLSFAQWLIAADLALTPFQEIALVGESIESLQTLLAVVRHTWRPNAIVAASAIPIPERSPALLENRLPFRGQPTAYVCHHFICEQPVTSPEVLAGQLQF
ncbi:MAG: thioredoxin domain-containing protein, partial [Anaerolineales bacterium]